MNTNYEKLLKLTEDDKVELATSFKNLLHTELCLGMTRYVCRNGTLSDGHEKITPAQRYYQAIKEMYSLGNNIHMQKAAAMEAQADYLDAQEALEKAEKQSDKLRAQAKLMLAENRMVNALVTVEDQLRQLDEFNQVRLELSEQVHAQYPLGIEQAEEDNWKAVAKYRALKANLGYQENLTHVPLAQEEKAKLGIELNRPDLAAWMITSDPEKMDQLQLEQAQKQAQLEEKKK